MKKILSLVLVTVMVMSLSIPVFAEKPAWAGNDKEERVEKELPKGLQDKAVIPYGHRKDQEVTVEDMEALIEKVEDYIDALDVDSDDDGIEDESVELIDLDEAEAIALAKIDGDIVKMSFDDGEYEFEILLGDTLYEVEVDGITKDVDFETEDDDEDYDLEDVMSYYEAKAAALTQVDDDDAIIVEVELEMEEADDDDDDDEDEENEATYTVEVKTATKTYEMEFDAFNGDLLEFNSETNDDDDDDDDWRRDRDRDRDDDDDEGMVSAIENLIDRIEYELEKDEPKLGHFMFQLEQKFNVLQKIYGEAPEKEDYTEDLEALLASLEDIKDDSVFTDDEQEAIQVLIDEIDEALDTEDMISEDVYEDFENDADEYLDMLDEVVEVEEVEALVTEIRGFVLDNKFGSEIGEYSQQEAMELLMLVFEYSSINEEDLEEYHDDLKLAYKKFKMSKLVAGEYLGTLLDYKADLEILVDEGLTDAEKTLRDSLIETITAINANQKITLATFYDLQEDALTLLEEPVETPEDYEGALEELIDDVKTVIFTSYEDVNQTELRNEKMTLLVHYFQGIEDEKLAETETEYQSAYDELAEALTAFNDFLEQE